MKKWLDRLTTLVVANVMLGPAIKVPELFPCPRMHLEAVVPVQGRFTPADVTLCLDMYSSSHRRKSQTDPDRTEEQLNVLPNQA